MTDADPLAMLTNTCSTCRFFAPIDQTNAESGDCHRYPPTSHPRVTGDDGDEPTQFPQFPQLYATDWCGEHQAAVSLDSLATYQAPEAAPAG